MSLAKALAIQELIAAIQAAGGRVTPVTLEVNATIPANAAAGTEVVANITTDPKSQTTEKVVTIPSTQEWYIVDIYVKDAADVQIEAEARILKNQREPKVETPPLSVLLATNQQKPSVPPAPVLFEPLSRLSINVVNIVPETTNAAKNVKFYVDVLIADYS